MAITNIMDYNRASNKQKQSFSKKQVLGAQSTAPKPISNILDYNKAPVQQKQSFIQSSGATPYVPNLGAQSTGGGGAMQQQQPQGFQDAPMESAPDQPNIDWDALIAPALQGLDAAESAAGSQFNAGVSAVDTGKTSQIARTNQSIGAQEGILETGRKTQQQGAESAADEARRQFSEIQQGLQARYGGTTGTGQFAGELAGRETLKGIGQIRQGLSNAMLEIDTKLQQVKEVGRIQLEDVESQAKTDKEQLKANLDSELAGIRREKGQLQQWKQSKAIEAIQQYQYNVQAAEQRNTSFKQQLYVNQQAAEQKLAEARRKGQNIAESFKVMNLSQGGQSTPVRVGSKGSVLGFDGNPVDAGSGALYNPGSYGEPKTGEDDILKQLGLE